MIVREDDTLVCEPCYTESIEEIVVDDDRGRWAFGTVDAGICSICGIEDLDTPALAA